MSITHSRRVRLKVMQRITLVVLVLIASGLAACNRATGASAPTIAATAAPIQTADGGAVTAADPATLPVAPTDTLPPPSPSLPTDAPSPSAAPSPTVMPDPTDAADLSLNYTDVTLYPVPLIYAGDKVTFQLLPHVPESINIGDVTAIIAVNGVQVAGGPLDRRNWNGQAEGVYEWAWDTTGLSGEYRIEVVLDPGDAIQAGDEDPLNNTVAITALVTVPTGQAARDAAAVWETTETNCCFIHVVSNTAAARDLQALAPVLEKAVQQAADRLTIQPSQKLHVYFIDRVVGQGGFAGTDMVVSYVDRRYAGGGLYELLVHESAHILDQQFAPQRISFLAEGLAVWVSGGHYKAEDLKQRSATLLTLEQYVPLAQLINDFYPVQHEIGYLEAAGLVTYLIDRGGWNTFKSFYTEVSTDDGPTLADAVDVNLQRYYGATLAQIENEWHGSLASTTVDPAVVEDLRTTIRYYNIARRYQELYDPTAHYLSAWLPHPTQVREFGNPADLTRRPETEMNVTLELMLTAADVALRAGDFARANVILDSVGHILDNGGTIIDPMATSYLNIVRAAAEYDYELHMVELQGNTARAMATQAPNIRLTSLVMELRGTSWVILSH
ncbi:protein of unknown function [Candidatus Promineifilum breve]|uniref:Peptidase M60 domain-containing protein n=2 Tax=Candidatus Promineifilum breve TaxID=1806508 RepID=A0A160T463_9CHLR|nr:protein of unknown function [Candidatus Promineifilum breve]